MPLNALRSLELLQSNLAVSPQYWPRGWDSIWRRLCSATQDIEGQCCGFHGPVKWLWMGLGGILLGCWSLIGTFSNLITMWFDTLHHRISILSRIGCFICEVRL